MVGERLVCEWVEGRRQKKSLVKGCGLRWTSGRDEDEFWALEQERFVCVAHWW